MITVTPKSLLVAALFGSLLVPHVAAAQNQSTLRVTVRDETEAALIHAVVAVIDANGVERQVLVDESGVAVFSNLLPGPHQVRVEAQGFQGYTVPFNVRRGNNTAVATLTVAIREDVFVRETDPAQRRDNGFTTTLTPDDIAGLSDDPEEMADQLRQMAGPGAQIFIDGFRGGRLPPKDQIQQIRFHTNSYAAEYHDAGMVRVEVITRPGMGGWRGNFNVGFRDESLNARNAFAPVRGPEQQKRFSFGFQGPVAKGKTSLAINADGNLSYDAQTIVARTPVGQINDQVRRPVDAVNASVRLEHAISQSNSLRAEYSRRDSSRRNLGVGDFDLAERAYENESVNDTLRVRNTRTIGKKLFSELRVELTQSQSTNASSSSLPTVRVLDAFTSGGAGQSGVREGRQFTVAQNFDFTVAKHALRAGLLVEGGWWDSNQQTNANGTFTFSSLDEFLAGRPRTYTRRVGDPDVSYSQYEAGWYVQDDFRVSKNINVSLGLRQEVQTHVADSWNLAPRVAFSWAVGKANVRGGYGLFYDWLESNIYEQTVRVDGTRQIDEVVINPSYPVVGPFSGTSLPPSLIQLGPRLTQPTIHQASVGYEKALKEWASFRTDYMMTRAVDTLRSINVNAPLNGVRPDPGAGNVTEIGSTGRRDQDRLSVHLMMRVPARRIMGNVMYQFASTRSFADSPLALPSDSNNPDEDWGPAGMDIRHRLNLMANTPVGFGVRASVQAQVSSAPPYTITTGLDGNDDTVFNDRPAGVSRNSARGASQWNVTLRVNRSFNLGSLLGSGPVMIGGPAASNAQRGPGGGDGGGMQVMMMEGGVSRYRLDLYVQAFNVFNTTNLNQFVGNLLSPYFGQATSASAPRRIELGASLSF
ncbi:MAG: carboxypeptidase regulatory-like domain-containing protein [Acidobacteriota bacterium]